ncbi:endonuclease/exonuclease/phosphatase family protein [Streptomyces sp. NA04227]|uniref:endonuclease/exonuclease/phosphatase family protein n=1 Tax=Streptomyces sp. NA04227 TaxID=2742136 RepID=UPI001592472F|nr:endonuclease/exonuclease/phosphatase family protein [Streptomyces sp. NA04227]QKW08027.1 endonuclease/exonuclease/phosphatase family protein [Streptomyces sp. NA04227]
MSPDTITLAVWNLDADGGADGVHWGHAHDILDLYRPDIVLRQEAKHSRAGGERRLHAAADRLGLVDYLSAPDPGNKDDIATSILIRPGMFTVLRNNPVMKPWWLHPTHLVVRFGNCPRLLNLVSFHMCFYDPTTRATEARWLTTLANREMATIVGGDTNSYTVDPGPVPPPQWPVGDRAHMVHRTIPEADGELVRDTEPDRILCDAGYTDLAAYTECGLTQSSARNPTAGYRRRDQGGPQRIDRVYGYGIHPAVVGVEVVDNDETRSVSDHALFLVRLDRGRLERVLSFAPEAAV